MIDRALFDFDGTISDTGPGIKFCVAKSLKDMGYPVLEEAVLNQFIGPPLADSFRKFCGIAGTENIAIVKHFRQLYNTEGIWQSTLYPGVKEGLEHLSASGRKLYLASSKPEIFVRKLLERFEISSSFAGVEAISITGYERTKCELVRAALDHFGSSNNEACMVGDRKFDIAAAQTMGIYSIGVSYGYGSMEELLAEEPNEIFSTFPEVVNWILAQP